ncbi:hypothetical protein GZH46_00565 [Fragariocoptes setiger]|uniref:MANSC domain-containing protein n=1 Tax=Fragariocoptes setiger TaxID=1670756 RepID=A0ABQ7SBW3_9ACAR|nr:hypothetical protein GZH46_00565 [Fragariocoptes setiger]
MLTSDSKMFKVVEASALITDTKPILSSRDTISSFGHTTSLSDPVDLTQQKKSSKTADSSATDEISSDLDNHFTDRQDHSHKQPVKNPFARFGDYFTIREEFTIQPATIIRTTDSLKAGAEFINHTLVVDLDTCLRLCKKMAMCDTAIYQETSMPTGHPSALSTAQETKFVCYLFKCAKDTSFKCRFSPHNFYISSVTNLALVPSPSITKHNSEGHSHSHDVHSLEHESDLHQLSGTEQQRKIYKTVGSFIIGRNQCNSDNKFECSNHNECIDRLQICDGVKQCSDGSDEHYELCQSHETTKSDLSGLTIPKYSRFEDFKSASVNNENLHKFRFHRRSQHNHMRDRKHRMKGTVAGGSDQRTPYEIMNLNVDRKSVAHSTDSDFTTDASARQGTFMLVEDRQNIDQTSMHDRLKDHSDMSRGSDVSRALAGLVDDTLPVEMLTRTYDIGDDEDEEDGEDDNRIFNYHIDESLWPWNMPSKTDGQHDKGITSDQYRASSIDSKESLPRPASIVSNKTIESSETRHGSDNVDISYEALKQSAEFDSEPLDTYDDFREHRLHLARQPWYDETHLASITIGQEPAGAFMDSGSVNGAVVALMFGFVITSLLVMIVSLRLRSIKRKCVASSQCRSRVRNRPNRLSLSSDNSLDSSNNIVIATNDSMSL